MNDARRVLKLVLGVVLIGMGLFVAMRPLWTHNGVLTGSRVTDIVFALFFLLRGTMNLRSVIIRRRA